MNYLTELHAKINAITPIVGLSEDADGAIIDVDYETPPTSAQLAQIQSLIAGWPLEKTKLEKLAQLDAKWAETLAAGWETPYGWKLGIDVSDVTLLMGAFMLAKEAAALGLVAPAHIIDTAGASHEISVAELTPLMLAYGQARAALSAADATQRQAINAATTLEELEAL